MRFYQYYESIITILLHFDSCPAKAIIIWINKGMSILPTQFRGVFVKFLTKRTRKYPKKMSAVESCFNKITGQRF